MLDSSTPLIVPALGNLYQALSPWVETLLRIIVGLALVPHGLRMTFGFFPSMTATQELVVPRSIPITLLIYPFLLARGGEFCRLPDR